MTKRKPRRAISRNGDAVRCADSLARLYARLERHGFNSREGYAALANILERLDRADNCAR